MGRTWKLSSGSASLRRAMQAGQTVVIDEIGKMELFCGPFREAALQAVNGPCTMLATVMAKPNPWVDGLKAMPQVEMWEVTVDRRDKLAEKVVDWLER